MNENSVDNILEMIKKRNNNNQSYFSSLISPGCGKIFFYLSNFYNKSHSKDEKIDMRLFLKEIDKNENFPLIVEKESENKLSDLYYLDWIKILSNILKISPDVLEENIIRSLCDPVPIITIMIENFEEIKNEIGGNYVKSIEIF